MSEPAEQRIQAWAEQTLGGRVVRLDRQARWRPNWLLDVEVGGRTLPLMVRGERVDSPLVFPLRHEMVFQELLHRAAIPVPEVYGWIDELPAYVSDRVPGRPDFADTDDATRDRVMAEYMRTLAAVHALDVEPFADAGITRAATPAQSDTIGLQAFEAVYRRTKRRPDPFLEFALGWLHRNPLAPHEREGPIVWDSGQFHHQDGRITAVLDLEIGHIGDPLMDLAAFRMRDTVLHFGDFETLYAIYADAAGIELGAAEMAAIQHHHLAFTLTNQLAFHGALADPPAGSAYMTNLQWCTETNLHSVEAFAELLGYELDDGVEVPEPTPSTAAVGHRHLVDSLGTMTVDDPFVRYEVRNAFRLARHLQRKDEIGAALDAADLDDLRVLLGHRPTTPADGDEALENFVLADGGQHDEELVRLFYRRFLRANAVLGPAGSAMARHHKVQPFRRPAGR